VTTISVAFLGPALTYSHLAAQTVQSDDARLVPCDTIDQVFAAIETRRARCGLVPLFNSSSGLVSDSVVAIVRRLVGSTSDVATFSPISLKPAALRSAAPTTQLCISASLIIPIQHCLVSWGERAGIRQVSSKQQALDQCRHWLDQNLPHAERLATDSSSAALHDLRQQPHQAAIVSRPAAISLAAPLCVESIQDQSENATEFVVVQLDAEDKPVLTFPLANVTNTTSFEYVISLCAEGAPTTVTDTPGSPISMVDSASGVSPTGSWSGGLFFHSVWFEVCKRPIETPLAGHLPWTGQLPSLANWPEGGPRTDSRSWRLGIAR
jgi:prephenate dehydratase